MDLYPHKSVGGMMEPIALQDNLVAIHYIKSVYYRRVAYFEGLPPFQAIDLGAIAAAQVGARTNVTRLDMYDEEFGQFRLYPLDNVQLRVFLPRGAARGDLKTIQVPIDPDIITRNPDLSLSEIFVWEDNRPAIEAVNGNAVGIATSRVIAMGYRFSTEEPGSPMTRQEKMAVAQLKGEQPNKKDTELLLQAIQEKMVPCTHIWASGMSART